MLESRLRPYYQRLLIRPLLHYFSRFHPIAITFMATATGLLAALLLYKQHILLSCFFLLLSGYFDTLDGPLARRTAKSSDLGAFFDILSDRIVEIGMIIALMSINPNERAFLCLFLMSSIFLCVCSFLLIGLFSKKHSEKSFHYNPGLIERAEAFIYFITVMIFPSFFAIITVIFIGLVLLTTALHCRDFINHARRYIQ